MSKGNCTICIFLWLIFIKIYLSINVLATERVWLLITNNFVLKRKIATLFERITISNSEKLHVVKNETVVSLSDF